MTVSNIAYIQEQVRFTSVDDFITVVTNLLQSHNLITVEQNINHQTEENNLFRYQDVTLMVRKLRSRLSLTEVILSLYFYADKKSRSPEIIANSEIQQKWEKLVNLLDFACEVLEQDDTDDYYLIY
ncbi:MAG: hypothetical protein QNJ32_11050 [Xenococcaceae cyanobacterium MO_167.B27]|nr:hypothetical protein [Xenococcaceae cyanobacterium MO_167.B27]